MEKLYLSKTLLKMLVGYAYPTYPLNLPLPLCPIDLFWKSKCQVFRSDFNYGPLSLFIIVVIRNRNIKNILLIVIFMRQFRVPL